MGWKGCEPLHPILFPTNLQKTLFHEVGCQQIVGTLLHALHLLAATRILNLHEERIMPIGIEVLEYLLEVHHSGLAQDETVLDVQQMDAVLASSRYDIIILL